MSFRDCPKCKECDTTFFKTDEDFGIYEVLECSKCFCVFSPQREEEKYRKMVHRIVFASLSIIVGFCGIQRGNTIVNFVFLGAIMVGWIVLAVMLSMYSMGDEPETLSTGPK